jgi:hypothetical protein
MCNHCLGWYFINKNLATLVVELNQKGNKLIIRVNQLEKLNQK